MESQTAVAIEKYRYKYGIKVNVWHPVTLIQEYLNVILDIILIYNVID